MHGKKLPFFGNKFPFSFHGTFYSIRRATSRFWCSGLVMANWAMARSIAVFSSGAKTRPMISARLPLMRVMRHWGSLVGLFMVR
jgi:hypothetical protein